MEIDNILYTRNEELNLLINAINIRLNHIASTVTEVEDVAVDKDTTFEIVNPPKRDGINYFLRFKDIPAINAKNKTIFVDIADGILKYKDKIGNIIPIEALNSDDIENVSTVDGASVSDALENLIGSYGPSVDPATGSDLVGALNEGAIVYQLVNSSNVGFPAEYGVALTFCGVSYGQTSSLFFGSGMNGEPSLYHQYFDGSGNGYGWREFSMQDTVGGGSNVTGGTDDANTIGVNTLLAICNINTPTSDYYTVETLKNSSNTHAVQYARSWDANVSGVWARHTTDDGVTWTAWLNIAGGGGGSTWSAWEPLDVSAVTDWEQWDSNTLQIRTDGKTVQLTGAMIYRGSDPTASGTFDVTFPDIGLPTTIGTETAPMYLLIGDYSSIARNGGAGIVFLSATSFELRIGGESLGNGTSTMKLGWSFPISE